MARLKSSNNVTTRLSAAITVEDTTLVVADVSKLPAVPFRISIENEIMEVTAVDANTLTVLRAQEGTAAAAHIANAFVNHSFTAGTYDELMDASASQPFTGDVEVKKGLAAYIFDALRAAKSKIMWNADETDDSGMEFHVDGNKAATLFSNGKFETVGDIKATDVNWGTRRTILLAEGTDLNTVASSGWYIVNQPLNPPVLGQGWWFVEHITSDNSNWSVQRAYSFYDLSKMYIRKSQDSQGERVWTPWGSMWHAGNDGAFSGLDADKYRGRVIPTFSRPQYTVNSITAPLTGAQLPAGASAGADAVSDPDQRIVYYMTPNATLTNTIFWKRDFIELYNVTGTWQQKAPISTIGQVWQNGAKLCMQLDPKNPLGHNIFAIFGGTAALPIYGFGKYDPAADTWTRLANTPVNQLPGSQIIPSDADPDVIFFIPGGMALNTGYLWRYNISTDAWTQVGGLIATATNAGTVGFCFGGKLFVKFGASAVMNRYDPVLNAWGTAISFGNNANAGSKILHVEGGTVFLNNGGGLATPLLQENWLYGLNAGNAVGYNYTYDGTVYFMALGKIFIGYGNNNTTLVAWGY